MAVQSKIVRPDSYDILYYIKLIDDFNFISHHKYICNLNYLQLKFYPCNFWPSYWYSGVKFRQK